MNTISLCMIVRDEEQTLDRCLCSAAPIADEIVIVDTGSVDKTVEIAEKYTNRIYHFDWIDDFAAARNFRFPGRRAITACGWTPTMCCPGKARVKSGV